MGLFAYSLSFRRTADMDWERLKPQLEMYLYGKEAAASDLSQDLSGYGMITYSRDTGAALPNLAERISRLTGDYVVNAQIIDSDFSLIQLYYNGQELEESYIGRIYLELLLQFRIRKPNMKLWLPLLHDSTAKQQYRAALHGRSLFVEEQLQTLSALTGLPILDDTLLLAAPECKFF